MKNSEYEKLINQLFDGLVEALKKRESILYKICLAFDSHIKIQEFEKDDLFEKLQTATKKVNEIIDILDRVFEEKIELKNPKEISEKIYKTAIYVSNAKSEFNIIKMSKNPILKNIESQNDVVHKNCKYLANKIIIYNELHDTKLLTFTEAITRERQDLFESLGI